MQYVRTTMMMIGVLLVVGCSDAGQAMQSSRAALVAQFPPELTLTGCGASNLVQQDDGGVPPAQSFVVQDLDRIPGIQCPGCVDGVYTIDRENWTEVLGLIYAGLQRDGSKDCNGDLRRSLVANWASLFPSGCNAGCTSLRRAWRPEDRAPATGALMAALGLSLPPARGTPGAQPATIDLCNAYGAGPLFAGDADYLDRDPIRVNCSTEEQTCGRIGQLGLVTAITVPSNLTQAEAYPAQLCGIGQFGFLQPALFLPPPCPNGFPPMFGKCFLPVQRFADGSINASCLARRFPTCGISAVCAQDGRACNTVLPAPSGIYRFDSRGRLVTGSYYRMHTTTSLTGATCTHRDSDQQTTCLAQAGRCVIGFAGK